jgi:hypothetical protein
MPKQPQIDPVLAAHLEHAAGNVTVVVTLRRPKSAKPASADMRALAARVLDETSTMSGASPTSHNVLANLGVLVVDAPVEFVVQLLRHDSITTAALNETPQ